MKRTAMLAVILALPACHKIAEKLEGDWTEFAPAGGGFSVQMPGTPKTEVTPDATQYILELRLGNLAYSVAHTPLDPEVAAEADVVLESAQGGLSEIGWTDVQGVTFTSPNGYPGRKVTCRTEDGLDYATHIYVANDKLYQAIVVSKPGWVKSADIDKFFRSFSIDGQTKPGAAPVPQPSAVEASPAD